MQAIIRRAETDDLSRLKSFLMKAGLGIDGLSEERAPYFLLLENEDNSLRGSLGIEPFNENGLLRSLVVTSAQMETDILLLFEQAFSLAKDKQIRHLFLATNRASTVPFFHLLGFQLIEKEELPKEFFESDHIKHILNVDNSLFFKLSI